MSKAEVLKVAYLLPRPGIAFRGTMGVSVHVESLRVAMAREGAQAVLYAAKVTGPLRAAGSGAVQVVPIDVGEVRSGASADRTCIAAARRFFQAVGRHLDVERPEWVHERLSPFAGAGGELCRTRGLHRGVEVSAPEATERLRHFGLELATEAHRAERAALGDARVSVVSLPMAEWAADAGASETVAVPNGAGTAGLDPTIWAHRRAQLRRRLGFDDQVVVGLAGSLKPWHGVDVLLDALKAIPSHSPLGLLIVGDGPGRAAIEQAVAGLPASVTPVLTGAVPFSGAPGYLAAMDISVAPYEPADAFYFSPLKAAEGMVAGRAMIASDFPPVGALVGSTGLLVTPGDAAELGSSIAPVVADLEARGRLGAMARARAVGHLGWDSVAAGTLASAMRPPQPVTANQDGR